jgi:hypothetical protein
MFAPTTRANRILIAVLAFALAVALAIVASVAPADAKDEKTYSVTVVPPSVNAGAQETYTVTFTNLLENTVTQRAGAFRIDFGGAGFAVDSSATDVDNSLVVTNNRAWEAVSVSGGIVVVSAESGGERIRIGESVTFQVVATAPPTAGLRTLESAADQADHGNFRGGSAFDKLANVDKPTINVVSVPVECFGGCMIVESTFTADLECGDTCSYLLGAVSGTTVADITVFEDGSIVLVLETIGKGPAPGSASVQVDINNDGDFDDEGEGPLAPCGVNGPPKCVHINRINGNHTQYTVFYSGDPRFVF